MAGGFGGDPGAGFEGRSFAVDWVLPRHLCHQRHFGNADRSSIYQETYFCGFPPTAGGQVQYCLVFHTLRWPRRVPASFNRVWNWFGKLNKAHTKKNPVIQLVQEQGLAADFAGTIFTPEVFPSSQGLNRAGPGETFTGEGLC